MFKIYNKFIITIIIFFTFNSYSNVIYDKKNIIISELDLKYYKEFHYQKFEEEISSTKALKNLVIIKKVINNLKKKNPDFIERIDKNISKSLREQNIKSNTIIDIIRYFNIKNEFIYDYYYNFFDIEELRYLFNSFAEFELPISSNNCLTILKLINVKDNSQFVKTYYENINSQDKNYEIFIEDQKYNVCINTRLKNMIEKEIFRFIELKIENNFERFVYDHQK